MGTQKRQPLAPAAAMRTIVPGNAVSSAHDNSELADPRTHDQLPVLSYHLYTLQPNPNTDPKSLMQTLNNNIMQTDPSISHGNIPRTVPIVLDMSAFCLPHFSPSPEGTMKKVVNAIISHANENESNIKFCIVGVTNLPPIELQNLSSGMMFEARSMNIPLLQNTINTKHLLSDNMPSSLHAPESSTTRLSTLSHSPPKKKRGGVAPLLRPRRPLIAITTNSTATDLKTKDFGDVRESVSEDTKQLHFLAAPFRSVGYHPSTKVHKGSIRSGQLVTSDYPNQSLVIIGSINPGGEVWSEGDVFVFGKLRGRVLAGLRDVNGKDGTKRELSIPDRNFTRNEFSLQDESETKQNNSQDQSTLSDAKQSSRIFATSFDPELVCIGGKFCRLVYSFDLLKYCI
jgi:septum formation inhibitor MinC